MPRIMTGGCDNPPVATGPDLTPAQRDVLDLLRAAGRDRPEVPADLRDDLRAGLEQALRPLAKGLAGPVFVSKGSLGRVLACEAHHLAERAAPFEWTVAMARGTVAHKAIQLSVGRRQSTSALVLVDEAVEQLASEPNPLGDFLLGLGNAPAAELRTAVHGMVASFVELWPPLERSWQPQTESPRRAELCDGTVVLQGRVDLTIGSPRGLVAGRALVDLKTGGSRPGHLDDLRYYALLDTLRVGVPPFLLVGYYLDEGRFTTEDVTEPVLEAAVRRTVAGVTKIVELELGMRSASTTAGPTCRWCPARSSCPPGRAYLAGDSPESDVDA
jgi:PD-(D/E)XK nuclease superfamily